MQREHSHKKTYYNDIALRLAEKLLGLKHLHYGYFEPGTKADLASFPVAQQAYVDHLIGYIPATVKRILDVGCGSGGVAKALVEAGYEVVCLAPDPYLIEKTLEATDNRVTTLVDLYENIDSLEAESFDLILMSESCQYVQVDEGWKQHTRFLKPGGFVLISDFFKRTDADLSHISKAGHVLNTFLAAAESAGFALKVKEDITEAVSPTMDLFQALIDEKVFPVAEAANEFLLRKYPSIHKVLRWRMGKKAAKIKERYQNQGADLFKKYKAYYVLLFQEQAQSATKH